MKKFILIIFAIIVFLVFYNNKKEPHYSDLELKQIRSAGVIKGFLYPNTKVLEDYCSETGYIPKRYISKLQSRLYKTILKSNEIIDKYNLHKKLNEQEKNSYNKNLQDLEESFNQYRNQYGQSKTKLDYCKQFDENYESIIRNKINLLNDTLKNDKYLQSDFIED